MQKFIIFILMISSLPTQTMFEAVLNAVLQPQTRQQTQHRPAQQTPQSQPQQQPIQPKPQPEKVEQKPETMSQTFGGHTTINQTFNITQDASSNNCINNKPQANAQATAQAQAEAEAEATASATVTIEMVQIAWNGYKETMNTFWHDNKLYFGLGALIACYSYYFYQVVCGNMYLKRTDIWSAWKHELSFEQLCLIPQQKLAHELLIAIQSRGLDLQRPTDFTVPLVVFLQNIEQERAMLLNYQTLYKRITTVKCRLLFPFNHKRYNQIETRLQRLSFVKNIFITWMAEFNFEHASRVQ